MLMDSRPLTFRLPCGESGRADSSTGRGTTTTTTTSKKRPRQEGGGVDGGAAAAASATAATGEAGGQRALAGGAGMHDSGNGNGGQKKKQKKIPAAKKTPAKSRDRVATKGGGREGMEGAIPTHVPSAPGGPLFAGGPGPGTGRGTGGVVPLTYGAPVAGVVGGAGYGGSFGANFGGGFNGGYSGGGGAGMLPPSLSSSPPWSPGLVITLPDEMEGGPDRQRNVGSRF